MKSYEILRGAYDSQLYRSDAAHILGLDNFGPMTKVSSREYWLAVEG